MTTTPATSWRCPDCGDALMIAAATPGAWTRAYMAWAGHDCIPRPHATQSPRPGSVGEADRRADESAGTVTPAAPTSRMGDSTPVPADAHRHVNLTALLIFVVVPVVWLAFLCWCAGRIWGAVS